MTNIPSVPAGFSPVMTTPVDPAGSSEAVRAPKKELDKDAFLNLLVTQMRYQDPSSPMDTSQMMAQTTQMTTVEQLTTLVQSSQAAFASQQHLSSSALVGRAVSWADAATGASGLGTVTAVRFAADGPVLRVGDADVPLAAVSGVAASAPA
ncbi:flagellar hook assembly protein FlgD [uncultured Pseudokineococcus sp.]|uniref:flagellar hook assembly protein FlgD n=1 Tax=uncultured Pseudokineococcus sp. TaxID=1642928 RepID=UPI00262DDD9A|nr:flagellar hook capping FlgD N-terminal domain-containing protein [uncultured Pseudokineococcus sp.]